MSELEIARRAEETKRKRMLKAAERAEEALAYAKRCHAEHEQALLRLHRALSEQMQKRGLPPLPPPE